MKHLLFSVLSVGLLASCKKEDITIKDQTGSIKVKLYADNGKSINLLDSVFIPVGKGFKDTLNKAKQANDLYLKYKGVNYQTLCVDNASIDSIPLAIDRPISTDYMLRFELDNIPYKYEDGKGLTQGLMLYDAAKTTSGETVIIPGRTAISGTRVTDYRFRDLHYVTLDKRFAILYKR